MNKSLATFRTRLSIVARLASLGLCVCAAFLWSPASHAQEPPRVTSTSPVDGTQDVPAGRTEISVEFNREMAESFSWTKGGDLFPQVIKPPVWVTPRKCVLTVKLEPNRLYTLGINGFTANRFEDKDGIPAEKRVICFRTAAPPGSQPVQFRGGPENLEVFNALQKAVNEKYSYRDLRQIKWEQHFDSFRQRVMASRTEDELTYIIADLLAVADDPHVVVEHDKIQFATTLRDSKPNFSNRGLGRSVENLAKVNETIYRGIYSDGIVYVLITSWTNDRANDISALADIMDNAKDAPGIIIDVRPNSGGNDLFCQALARRFVTEKIVYEKIRLRDQSAPGGFSEVEDRVLEPLAGGPLYAGKVAVLMGPANMSSCEAFLLMMKQVKQAQLFGEPSFGSSGNPQPHEIGAGISVHLPSWQALLPDGEFLEGKGVTPDVLIETTEDNSITEDPVIKGALEWLRAK